MRFLFCYCVLVFTQFEREAEIEKERARLKKEGKPYRLDQKTGTVAPPSNPDNTTKSTH